MTGTWATDWATNDVVTAAEFRKSVGCVFDSTLGGAAASIDITGIPTTYAHLMVLVYGRGDSASTAINVNARLNNDSATNYGWQYVSASGSTASAADQGAAAVTSILLGQLPAASAPANVFGQINTELAHYANATNQKTLSARSLERTAAIAASSMTIFTLGGVWTGTAAINRITLFPASGNFVAGTRASVYVMGS